MKIKCPDGSTSENIDMILKEQVNFILNYLQVKDGMNIKLRNYLLN